MYSKEKSNNVTMWVIPIFSTHQLDDLQIFCKYRAYAIIPFPRFLVEWIFLSLNIHLRLIYDALVKRRNNSQNSKGSAISTFLQT